MCCKLESVGHCLWEKQYHDAIQFSRNLEMACCSAWHSMWRIHSPWMPIWRQCRGFEKSWMSSVMVMKVWQLWNFSPIVLIRNPSIHLLTRPQIQHEGPNQVPREQSAALEWNCGCWKNLHLATGCYTMIYKKENAILADRKFLQPH